MPAAPPRTAVVVKGYPRLSETFIAQELLGLERRGLPLLIVSLRHPTDPSVHELHRQIAAPVLYLPEYLHQEPTRVQAAWREVRRWPTYRAARRLWLEDLRRDPSRNRVRRFGQALVLAAELPADVGLLYAHYLHTPASVTRYAARLAGPGCVSAHAKDIWTIPDVGEARQARRLPFRDGLQRDQRGASARAGARGRGPANLSRPGCRALPRAGPAPGPDGSDPARPVRLLGVARLVPKKGVEVLLEALAALPPGAALALHPYRPWTAAQGSRGQGAAARPRRAHPLGRCPAPGPGAARLS